MEDAGAELIPPSIAINAGMYYQKQKNGKLALLYEANISAKPVVAFNFKRDFDLLDLLKKGINSYEVQNLKKIQLMIFYLNQKSSSDIIYLSINVNPFFRNSIPENSFF